MADLTLRVGTFIATRTVTNALALEILGDFIKANNTAPTTLSTGTGVDVSKLSQQEQLDWIVDQVLHMIVQSANSYKKRSVIDAAVITSGVDSRGWK